jgi:serine/threonine protein kinase
LRKRFCVIIRLQIKIIEVGPMAFPNQQIGPYRLIKRLGLGGFGEVWLAEKQTKFVTKKLAVKLPVQDQVDSEAVKHEATLWEQASGHPNVLPIIDADEYDGQIVIVSEYAPDGSLADLLKHQGRLSVEKSVEMIDGILAGLEYLHSRNIVHRDLKPDNVLLQGATPRLADFGISRVLRTTVTSSSVNLAGTPFYMAPEAFDKKRNEQTDIWAIGVIFYEILTGKRPFDEDNLINLVSAIATKEPEPLPDNVPRWIIHLIFKALAKKPENRYKTAHEMRSHLRQLTKMPETQQVIILPDSTSELRTEVITSPQPETTIPTIEEKNNFFVIGAISLFAFILLLSGIGGMIYYFQPKWIFGQNTNNNTSQKEIAQNTNKVNNIENSNLSNANSDNVNQLLNNSSTNINQNSNVNNLTNSQTTPTPKRVGLPKFADYPVTEIYSGRNAPVILDSESKTFKTRLNEASLNKKVNFGGHFIVTAWGCGTGCLMGAVIDAISGKVYMIPFSVSGWDIVDGEFKPVDDNFQPIEYRLNSNLIVFSGYLNEKDVNGAHFYKFENGQFVFLYTNPRK